MPSTNDGPYAFAVCLSHDIDRVYKTYQYVWNAIQSTDPRELVGLASPANPYWTFERIMALEAALGVRSSFNVLDEMHITERPLREWVTLEAWKLFAGRYDVEDLKIAATLRTLNELGWEIGLHGSYTSSENPERFAREKARIEDVADTEIVGNRQHYWNCSQPTTWRHLRDAGIGYDTSLGSSTKTDFEHGYELLRPFDDEFVVFPWSLMDGAVMGAGETTAEIREKCDEILATTRDHRSVLVLDWHAGDVFSPEDYPGWGETYEYLIERAQEMNAWVGPPGEFYRHLPHPDGTVADALEQLWTSDRTVPTVDAGQATRGP